MSKWKNTGGPAFPRPYSEDTHNGTLPDGNDAILSQDGMSLRDWFAGQALIGICVKESMRSIQGSAETDQLRRSAARIAYSIADAMLAERES